MRIGKTTHNALQILIAAARSSNSLLKGADIHDGYLVTQCLSLNLIAGNADAGDPKFHLEFLEAGRCAHALLGILRA